MKPDVDVDATLEEELETDMEDIDIELEEDLDVDEDLDDEDLHELKASFGDPSEVPEPVTGAGGPVKKRRADVKKKGHDAHVPAVTGLKKNTKVGVMQAIVKEMSDMDTEDLLTAYNAMMEDREVIIEASGGPFKTKKEAVANARSEIGGGREGQNFSIQERKDGFYWTENVKEDYEQDINAIFSGEELDEETKEKAKTVFEAAVTSRVNEMMAEIAEQAETSLEEQVTNIKEELTSQLDSYLDYVVEEWMEENQLAVDSGIKAEMTESFLGGLKSLFEEHYVEIPEEKVDVVEEFSERLASLEEELNETLSKNVELASTLKQYELANVFAEATDDLSDVQAEKLRSLAEGVEFNSSEDYREKIELLKNRYFGEEVEEDILTEEEDGPVSLDEEVRNPHMAAYLASISKTVKK